MTEEEFRANPPRPGDKVWIAPLEVESVHNASVVGLDSRGYPRTYYPADIDRIERAPRVPAVGDRVRHVHPNYTGNGTIRAIDGDWALVRWADDDWTAAGVRDLQVIEP